MKRDNLSQHELKEKSLIFHLAYKEISCVDNLFARLNYHKNLLLKIQSRANDLRWDKFDHFLGTILIENTMNCEQYPESLIRNG